MKKRDTVYFLQRGDGLIKIGYSSDFPNRFKALSKSHPGLKVLRLINGDMAREYKLHHQLREHHEYGEWFRPSPSLLAFIDEVEAGPGSEFNVSEVRKNWAAFEKEHSEECQAKARKLYSLCFARRGETFLDVAKYFEDTYGLPMRTFQRLFQGNISVPSSAVMKRIALIHIEESQLLLQVLREEMEEVQDLGLVVNEETAILDKIDDLRIKFEDRKTLVMSG